MFKSVILMRTLWLFILSAFINACVWAVPIRKEMPLEKYNFIRDKYQQSDIEFLMGNGEMGGLALKSGLGFEKLWFTDVWENNCNRLPVAGPEISINGIKETDYLEAVYSSELNLKNGIMKTLVAFQNGIAYTSSIFFSRENMHRLVINLKNQSKSEKLHLNLLLADSGYRVKQNSSMLISASCSDTNAYTRVAWCLKSDKPFKSKNDNFEVQLKAGESITLIYTLATHFDNADYMKFALDVAGSELNYSVLEKKHLADWEKRWKGIASVILPEGEYARWFYRCLYTLYATAGAEKFLPAETQFSYPEPDWNMHHFTYGHGGWAIWDFAFMGDKENAVKMAKWHFKPEALRQNVKILFPVPGPHELVYKGKSKSIVNYLIEYNPEAMCFGHEVTADGYDIPYRTTAHWDLQRHVDAFGASMFHVVSQLYPDSQFLSDYTYPVFKGTSETWSSLVKWDSVKHCYYLPPLLSVSENIMEKSVLDAVLAARWNLITACSYAQKMGLDEGLRNKWLNIAQNLYIPQNDSMYLEYMGDNLKRTGGGYFGIRAHMYLGFPVMESLKDIDKAKARKSLDLTWERNNKGEGMITFISNWFALTESYLGNGNNAFNRSSVALRVQDPTGAALYEVFGKDEKGNNVGINPYFLTGYSTFLLVPVSMLLQSVNGTISVFPAIPDHWTDVEFYDLPASRGIKVSGVLKAGKVQEITFYKNNNLLLTSHDKLRVKITEKNDQMVLEKI